jgi:hypothetical protein
MRDRPWFLWDVPVTEAELRVKLRTTDPDARAQWQARIMREACFSEVWRYLSVDEIVDNWEYIRRHLGRRRRFWEWLLDGWRSDGLIGAA